MIITRTPLRISLGGGGTDLPSYYRDAGQGFLIAAAITKYVYIAVHRNFDDDVLLKYSSVERVPHGRARPPTRCCASACSSPASTRASRSRRWPTSRRAPASVRRARSRSACSRRCARSTHEHVSNVELAAQACHIEIDRARRAGRQAGPVHRRGRRDHRRSSSTPTSGSRSMPLDLDAARRATGSRTTSCCSTPASAARRPRCWPSSRRAAAAARRRSRDNLDRGPRRSGYETRDARSRRRPRRVRRAAHRAVAAEVRARARARARRGRRVDHARASTAGAARRQARRRRRRRLPALLRRGQGGPARRDGAGSASRRSRFGIDYEGVDDRS